MEAESEVRENSFLSRNFRIYITLCEETSYKYYQSILVISLSFVQLLTSHLHCYALYFVKAGSFLDYIITAFSYFDIFNLLTLGTILYKSLFFLACGFAYLYFFAYLMLLFASPLKIKKHFFTSIFVYFSKYYAFLLFFPSVIILTSKILCPHHVFANIDMNCSQLFPTEDILTLFLACSGLSASILMVFLNAYFCYSTWYIKTDYFSTHYERFLPAYHLSRLISAILMVIPTENPIYTPIYLSLNLIMAVFLLYLLLKYFPFSKFLIIKLFLFFVLLFLSQTIAMFIDYLTINHLYFNQTNSIFFMFVTFFAFELGFFTFFEAELINIVKRPENLRMDFYGLIKKIRILHYIATSFTPAHLVYFKGILTFHFENCRNPWCFCKSEKIFDAKKGRELEIAKGSALKGVFAKYLIKNWFEDHLLYNIKDPKPSIFYADFLFKKMKNIHMALGHLYSAERKAFSFNDKRKILQFRQQIKSFVLEKNSEFCQGQLTFEIIVFLEDQLEKLINLKRRFLKRSVKFWKILENSFLDLTELNEELAKLMEIKEEITRLWGPLKPYLDSKKQLKFYYQWYLKNIMNKKLRISDEEIKNFDTEEEDFISVDSKDLMNETKNDEKLIYQQDCCVMHVKSSASSLGNVAKVNSAINEVFEYNKGEIVGSEINRIMAPFFARNHANYVEKFIKLSRSTTLYSTKLVFGLNKSGFVFPLWIVLKQFIDNLGALEYVAMLKPLKTKKYEADYIILNEFGIIDGLSKGICEQLLLEPEFFKRNQVNILLISPKLVKFFTYEKYLKKDEKREKEKKKKKKEKAAAKRKNTEILKKNIVVASAKAMVDKKKAWLGNVIAKEKKDNKEAQGDDNESSRRKSKKFVVKQLAIISKFIVLQ